MEREDYYIRQLKELGRVLATLISMNKAKQYEKAILLIDQTMQQLYGLDVGFAIEDITKQSERFSQDDLRYILQFMMEKTKFYDCLAEELPKKSYFQKALQIFTLYNQKSTTFDLDLSVKFHDFKKQYR
jgi:hypothetical protein